MLRMWLDFGSWPSLSTPKLGQGCGCYKFGEVGQLPRKIISTEQSTTMQRFTNSELIYPFIYGGLIVESVKDGSWALRILDSETPRGRFTSPAKVAGFPHNQKSHKVGPHPQPHSDPHSHQRSAQLSKTKTVLSRSIRHHIRLIAVTNHQYVWHRPLLYFYYHYHRSWWYPKR